VLVVVGVRPNTELLESAGATLGAGGAVVVDEHMRTGLPHVWAAGDGVTTHHRLLGAQLVGRRGTETAKRVDTYATALHAGLTVEQISDLDLSYTPPLGSPWDAVQVATQAWAREHVAASLAAAPAR
jgi:hypothetical protein